MHIGVIGCGTIATSIITGLLTSPDSKVTKCHVTARSKRNSAALLSNFGADRVCVYDEAQDILDVKDVGTVFVCLLPEKCEEVLAPLKFDATRMNVVSLVSTGSCSTVRGWTFGEGVAASGGFGLVSKMICLPSVASCSCPSLITPPTPYLKALVKPLGGVVECSSEDEMTKMMIPTCLMGPYYKQMKEVKNWLVSATGAEDDTQKQDGIEFFIKEIYRGMARDLESKSIDALISEQTPGGINEMSIRNWEALGGTDVVTSCCDGVLERLTGKGSGKRSKQPDNA